MRIYVVDGEPLTITEAARRTGLARTTISDRMRKGYTLKEAMERGKRGRRGKLYKFRGEAYTLDEWCEISGVKRSTLRMRIKRGLPMEAVLDPEYNRRTISAFGESHTVAEWAELIGYSTCTIYRRLKAGSTIEGIAEGTAYGKIQADKKNP